MSLILDWSRSKLTNPPTLVVFYDSTRFAKSIDVHALGTRALGTRLQSPRPQQPKKPS